MPANTQFLIVSGLSGAGKSQALKILEDLGYSTVDNMPVELVPKFAELCIASGEKFRRVGIGIDVRAGKRGLDKLGAVLDEIKKLGVRYRILFLTANDSTLLQRYSETRHKHPLASRVMEGIKSERKVLAKLMIMADHVVDTSQLTLGELKEVIAVEMKEVVGSEFSISVTSFGYKYGLPIDADIVMDVRFLPNPNYVPSLRYKTGKDAAVRSYVFRQKLTKQFFKRFVNMLEFLIPNYIKEGKSHLSVAVGCTGGHHRSVALAEAVAHSLKQKQYKAHIYHRDIGK
jgi:UPF0042 nucleotide-binding protein